MQGSLTYFVPAWRPYLYHMRCHYIHSHKKMKGRSRTVEKRTFISYTEKATKQLHIQVVWKVECPPFNEV